MIARIYASKDQLYTFPSIVWTAIAGLRCSHPQYFGVYHTSLRLLHALMYRTSLFDMMVVPMGKGRDVIQPRALLEYAQGWTPAFEGIQPLLTLGLCHPITFHLAVSVLAFLLRIDATVQLGEVTLVDAPSRTLLMAAVAVLPWLACELTVGPHVNTSDSIVVAVRSQWFCCVWNPGGGTVFVTRIPHYRTC